MTGLPRWSQPFFEAWSLTGDSAQFTSEIALSF
jgi:hypothetical protein